MTLWRDPKGLFECPECLGTGYQIETVTFKDTPAVTRRTECVHCARTGKVTADEYMRIMGMK